MHSARTMQLRLAWICGLLSSAVSFAQVDGGPAEVDAGVAAPSTMFDVAPTPWGPGRKSSGEVFHSMAAPVGEGALRWSWHRFSLGIGAQHVARGEARDNADFARGAKDFTLGFDQRARVSVRGSAYERLGVLIELQDVRGWGSEPNTTTLTPNTGLHQGFVDIRATSFLDVRVGRQELSYGEERLVGSLDWSQTGRAFDGLFARVTLSPHLTVDAFGMVLKAGAWVNPDGGGPRFQNSGSYFTGAYARARFGLQGFDLYALGLLEDPGTAAVGFKPDHNRLTLGARGFTTIKRLALVAEGAYQTGVLGHSIISAGAFAGKATWVFNTLSAPYLVFEVSGASGDGNPTDSVVSTFHQHFPTGHAHLGFMDYVGWQNVVGVRGTVGFRPWGAHLWLDVHHFSAWAPKDAWYAANGSVFIAADPLRLNADRGTEFNLSATVPLLPNVALAGAAGVFLPGDGARPVPGSPIGKGTHPSAWGFLSVRSQL